MTNYNLPHIKSKLPDVGTTIFTVMSQMAEQFNAINLSQGFPDFDGPQPLKDRACHYLQTGHNQYSPLAGIAPLRQQIAAKVLQLYGHRADADLEITVVPGATEALFCAIQASVGQGDEVIVFDPAYDSYDPAIRLSGATPVHIPLLPPDFAIDWQQVRDRVNARTRMIIINSPHNPTGTVLDQADMLQLSEIVISNGLLLLSDEVYEHLVYDGLSHESVLKYPDLAAHAFAVFSFGKTYHVTGWKTGYAIAPPQLMAEFRKVHQFVSFVGVTPLQHGLADFMRDHPAHFLQLADFYQQKRDLFCDRMSASRFTITPSSGSYFQLADYSAISDLDDMAFASWLTREMGVAAIPISAFYQEKPQTRVVRFCFCKQNDTLEKAAEKLCAI